MTCTSYFHAYDHKVYLQRVWSISLRICVGLTHKLTHSNKHIIFHILDLLRCPLFSINAYFSIHLLDYHGSHSTFNTSAIIQPLHVVIIFLLSSIIFSDWVHRNCAHRKSVIFMSFRIRHYIFLLLHHPLRPPKGQKWSWKRKRINSMIWKWLQRRGRMRIRYCREIFWRSCRGEEGWGHQNAEHFLWCL